VSWPRWIREKVREFVTACTGADWPGRRDQAQRLLDELPEEAPQASIRRKFTESGHSAHVDKSALAFPPPSGSSQRERKAERNDRMRVLRIKVLRRARGRCEFRCAVAGEPTDAHHVFGGADRVELESEYTLAAICEDCHDHCGESPAWAREQGLAWARRMAVEAQLAKDAIAAAEFVTTATRLEARIALAAAQARQLTAPEGT
jgi:hypothetical protein